MTAISPFAHPALAACAFGSSCSATNMLALAVREAGARVRLLALVRLIPPNETDLDVARRALRQSLNRNLQERMWC